MSNDTREAGRSDRRHLEADPAGVPFLVRGARNRRTDATRCSIRRRPGSRAGPPFPPDRPVDRLMMESRARRSRKSGPMESAFETPAGCAAPRDERSDRPECLRGKTGHPRYPTSVSVLPRLSRPDPPLLPYRDAPRTNRRVCVPFPTERRSFGLRPAPARRCCAARRLSRGGRLTARERPRARDSCRRWRTIAPAPQCPRRESERTRAERRTPSTQAGCSAAQTSARRGSRTGWPRRSGRGRSSRQTAGAE